MLQNVDAFLGRVTQIQMKAKGYKVKHDFRMEYMADLYNKERSGMWKWCLNNGNLKMSI